MSTPLRNPIHLFRAILREATYLPNAAARTFHAKHVAAAFRKHRQGTPAHDAFASPLPSKDETYYLRRARKYLYMLQRANQGYLKNLESVLKMTYARKGKRRRELMDEILKRSSETERSPDGSGQWKPSLEFTTLTRRQNKVQEYFDKRNFKQMPKIPLLTRSNRPFPKRRVQKMMERWYARQAAIIQPPLTESEWLSVYRQSTHQQQEGKTLVPKRRSSASVRVFAPVEIEDVDSQHELELIGCTSTQKAPTQQSRRVRAFLGNPHHLTPRFLRRFIRRTVLHASPVVLTDVENGKIAPRWDLGTKPQFQPQVATTSQCLTLFY